MSGKLRASALDRRIRIEKRVAGGSFTSAGAEHWEPVASVRASVVDMLPSRGERLADGLNIATRPARVRVRYRSDITAAMRVLIGRYVSDADGNRTWVTSRTTHIVTPPIEIGRREGLEFMVEDYSTAGGAV